MANYRAITLILMIFAAAASRVLPHPLNFTPIGAMALFGGAYFTDKRMAFLVPLSAMLLGDLVLGFHSTLPFVYAGFAIMVAVGMTLHNRCDMLPVMGATLLGSVVFFILTNFGVWALENMYPKNLGGLVTCYVAAIPFFHNSIAGDLVYTTALFGGFAWLANRIPELRLTMATNNNN